MNKSLLQCWKDLIGEVEKDPWSFQNSYQEIGDQKKDPWRGQRGLGQAHRTKPVSTGRIIPARGPKLLHRSMWGAFYTRVTKESEWKAKSQNGTENRGGAK